MYIVVKYMPVMQETWVRSLGWEDFLEEGMAIHSSILVWRVPMTEKPGGLYRVAKSQTQLSDQAQPSTNTSFDSLSLD